jgi:hypothetical protein
MNELKNENQVQKKEENSHDARAAKGWKFMALGSFIGFLGCVFTMLDIIPGGRDFSMFGLTSTGVLVAFYGCYLVFEKE